MMSNMFVAALMMAGVLAQPVQHVHKRDNVFVTVMETHYVTAGVPAASPVENPVAVQANVDTQSAVPTISAPELKAVSDASIVVAPASTAAAAAETSSSSSSGSSSGSVSVGSGGALGISYSPYNDNGSCKSASEVASDLAQLTGFSVIRLYGTDCNQVANVYAAKGANQKLFLGVYDMGNIANDCQAMHDGINGDWGCVHTVSIGNELVNSGQASVSQVGGYVAQGRSALKGLGYTGPIVAVDTFIAVINNPGLCEFSDYMAVNAHAFFDGNTVAANAGPWAVDQTQRVWTACGGAKSVLISESGWPKQGSNNGAAIASPEAHDAAISSLKNSISNDVILYSAFNDMWKNPGYLGVEQYWGIY